MPHRAFHDDDSNDPSLTPAATIGGYFGDGAARPRMGAKKMIRHVLLATNGSKTSLLAEDYALALVQAFQATLTVVHVCDDRLVHYGEADQLMTETTKEQFIDYIKNRNDTASQRIRHNFSDKADKSGVEHSFVIKFGTPAKEILALAEEEAAELLVMGSGSRSVRRLVPSSGLAAKILRNSPCPVFTAL